MAAGTGSYEWRFDSGRVCLDLVATAPQADRAGAGCEPLAEPGRLSCWLAGAGLVPVGTRIVAVDDSWVTGFVELRECLGQLVAAALEGRAAGPALETLNALAEGPPPGIRAVRDENGTLVRALSTAPGRDALLAAVARDAVDLLTDPLARSRLRRCEGDSCARVYLDTSRGRRRRWCSSEVCGNRERVARHRRKAAAH
ncbi:CGNR zinc finger domain-containing protein [Streptomyces sp. 5K101]|uniref:CGNR zinc finger domain-containing protein n=1 Tax=Streptomyces sp. 5K101 TaxID=3390037 RepID=UPI003974E474